MNSIMITSTEDGVQVTRAGTVVTREMADYLRKNSTHGKLPPGWICQDDIAVTGTQTITFKDGNSSPGPEPRWVRRLHKRGKL